MLSESEQRAAVLAVSRYGADSSRVSLVVQSMLERRAHGDGADLLELFKREQLLTDSQARELRVGLEKTLVAPLAKNGFASPEPQAEDTIVPGGPFEDDGDDDTVTEPRALGDYRILRRLGSGGTGSVFLAYHATENRQVAIKILAKSLARKQTTLDRFYREAKSGALLNHPNIVRNLDVGRDQVTGMHYLILEYVDGPSGLDLLDKFQHLPVGDALHIVLDVARALEHAHRRNIVHRDIKPGNILITLSGLAKLADMGLAKRLDETSHLTHAQQGFGTPYYMPYEQAMNAKDADARSDIYALGATLYHLVVGDVPFPGESSLEVVDKKEIGTYVPASRLNPDVPRVLDRILAKMLALKPADRYQTASELIVDLERSNLAASLTSFTDPDRALQDPVVRQRLTALAATQPDLQPGVDRPLDEDQLWYLRYPDRQGQPCTAKLRVEEVQKKLRDGTLSRDTLAARFPRGNYQPLSAYVEFQELSRPMLTAVFSEPSSPVHAAAAVKSTPLQLSWWLAMGLVAGMAILLIGTLLLWLRG